jgi:hypothetical protein
MPANKRPRRERTEDWQKIQQYTLWPEQKVYELLRPIRINLRIVELKKGS